MISINNNNRCHGMALVMVLIVVGTIAIVAIGFIARGDMELACGSNMAVKTAIDYLAESGLEHARGLILNPQDVADEYWTGGTGLQLDNSSNDYYDVSVMRDGYCDYTITSTAYRVLNGKRIAQTKLEGKLRIDNCIAVRTGNQWTTEEGVAIVYGDVYAKDNLNGLGQIYGDAFAKKLITATNITGSETENVPDDDPPVEFPDWEADDFAFSYRIGGSTYSSGSVPNPLDNTTLGPTAGNPAGIYYYDGNLEIMSNVTINGMLAVRGEVRIMGSNNTITAEKNFPAIIADNKIKPYDNSQILVNGLVYSRDEIEGKDDPENASLIIIGALLLKNNIDNMEDFSNSIIVYACQDKAAVKFWNTSSTYAKWSPANGAFFKSITRVE